MPQEGANSQNPSSIGVSQKICHGEVSRIGCLRTGNVGENGAKGRPRVQHSGQLGGREPGHVGLRGDGRPSPAAHEEHGGAAVGRGAAEGPLQPPGQRALARGVRPEAAAGRAEGVLPGPVQGNAGDNGLGRRPVRHQECLRSQGEAGAETEPAALRD